MQIQCILCNSANIQIVEKITTKKLQQLYWKKLKIDISHYFREAAIHYCKCPKCYLHFFYPLREGDKHFYHQLQKFEWYYQEHKPEFSIVLPYLPLRGKLLEIGCGNGNFAALLPQNLHYTGLEISTEAAQIAQNQGFNVKIETIEKHAQNHVEHYHAVCAFQLLEHVPNVYNFLNHSIKVLKKEGLLIIAVPCMDSFIAYAINNPLNLPPHHLSHWYDKTLQYLPELFPISLKKLIHVSLEPIHYEWYTKTLFFRALCNLMKLKPKNTIDTRLSTQAVEKFSGLLAKIFFRGMDSKMAPRGHTVIAIYKKI